MRLLPKQLGQNMKTENNLIAFDADSPLAVLNDAIDTHNDFDSIMVVGVLKNGKVRIINSSASMASFAYIKVFLDKWILEKLRF